MIEKTKQEVEGQYCRDNGYEHDATVIYGDTDSVMVRFGPTDLPTVMRMGMCHRPSVTEAFLIGPTGTLESL